MARVAPAFSNARRTSPSPDSWTQGRIWSTSLSSRGADGRLGHRPVHGIAMWWHVSLSLSWCSPTPLSFFRTTSACRGKPSSSRSSLCVQPALHIPAFIHSATRGRGRGGSEGPRREGPKAVIHRIRWWAWLWGDPSNGPCGTFAALLSLVHPVWWCGGPGRRPPRPGGRPRASRGCSRRSS